VGTQTRGVRKLSPERSVQSICRKDRVLVLHGVKGSLDQCPSPSTGSAPGRLWFCDSSSIWSAIVNETWFCSKLASRTLCVEQGGRLRLEEHTDSLLLNHLVLLGRQRNDAELEVRLHPYPLGDQPRTARLRQLVRRRRRSPCRLPRSRIPYKTVRPNLRTLRARPRPGGSRHDEAARVARGGCSCPPRRDLDLFGERGGRDLETCIATRLLHASRADRQGGERKSIDEKASPPLFELL
jgi:hypothetical protein